MAFQLTAVIAVMSNCSLLAIDLKKSAGQDWTKLEWFSIFVAVEHLLIAVFIIVNKVIPNVPKHVKFAMDKTDFHFKQKQVRNIDDGMGQTSKLRRPSFSELRDKFEFNTAL